MKIKKGKCKVLPLTLRKGTSTCRTDQLESRLVKKDQGILLDNKLSMRHQCTLKAKNANSFLHCIRQNTSSRLTEVILPQYSALVRPHLEFCIHFWALQYKRDMDILRRVQQGAIKIIKGLDHLAHEESLTELAHLGLRRGESGGNSSTNINT